jgi:Holliday junction resolvasome RuvABC endonuclease subunit
MISMGIDPSSSHCGVAVLDVDSDGTFHSALYVGGFTPLTIEKADERGLVLNMLAYIKYLTELEYQPEVITIEKLQVAQNLNSVRKLLYYEAASLIAAASFDCPINHVAATSARRAGLGKGNTSKEAAMDLVLERYADAWVWPPKMRPAKNGSGKLVQQEGLDDLTDAFVQALAGPVLLSER